MFERFNKFAVKSSGSFSKLQTKQLIAYHAFFSMRHFASMRFNYAKKLQVAQYIDIK